jgi:hypothetical protein
MADNKDVKRGIVLYLDGKEVKNNAVSIKAEMKKVRQEIENCTIGSEEYVAATKKYQQLNAILADHKNKLKGINDQLKDNKVKSVEAQKATKNWLQWGIDKFNAYSVAIVGAAAALTGVTMKLMAFKKLGREKQESQANLKALTGLDDDSISWLTKQAEILSTTMDNTGLRVRKSSKEILDAYMLVGSAKPELLKDKEALNDVTIEAMRLAEAAKMNLKDAVDGLTLALNQYGHGADKAARYVNVLAAGSKAGAAGVEAQTASIIKSGVAASTAKVPIEQLVGSIETLAEKGIKGEVAGTGLKTFFLKLEGGAKECRPSVVGLQQALENLQAKNMSAAEMQKMFGLEAYTVAQAMISGAESVKKYTEAVTDTNVAAEQAAINSDTDAAKLDQLKNKMNETGIILANRLSPFFSHFTNLTAKFVQTMPAMIDFLQKYGVQMSILAASIYLYNVRLKIASALMAAYKTVVELSTVSMNAYRRCMVLTKDAVVGCSMATQRLGLTLRNQNIITKTFVATSQLLRAAWYLVTLQFASAKNALKAFNVTMAQSGWGMAILAIGAATAAIYTYREKVKEANEAKRAERERLRESMKDYHEAYAKLKALNKIVEDETVSLKERKKALEEIKKMVPEYHAELTTEGELINDNKIALDNYLDSLKKATLFKANKDRLADLYQTQQDLQEQRDDKYQEWRDVKTNNILGGRYSKANSWGYSMVVKLQDALKLSKESQLKGDLDELDEQLNNTAKEIKAIEDKVGKLSDFEEPKEHDFTDGDGDGDDGGDSGIDPDEEEQKKRVKKALQDIETEANRKLAELKQQYIDGEIKSEEEYSQKAEQIEMERLKKSLEVAGLEPEERNKLANKVQDIYVKAKKQLLEWLDENNSEYADSYENQLRLLQDAKLKEKAILDNAHSLGLLDEEAYGSALLKLDEKYLSEQAELLSKEAEKDKAVRKQRLDDALLDLRENRAEGLLTDEVYNEKVREATLNFYDELLADTRLNDEQLREIERQRREYIIQSEEETASTIIEKRKQMFDAMRSLAEALGEDLANFITDSEISLSGFFKNMLKTILDSIEKMLTAYIAQKTIQNVAMLGIGGIAKAAMEIALMKAAFQTAKAAIGGFESGGYTGYGAHDEPAGIVHKGEFVANRFALANPAVRSVLDLIDGAQRSGSVQNLSREDISVAAGGIIAPPYVPSAASTQQNVIVNPPENAALIDLLQTMKERFKEPLVAETYATGKGGTMEAQRLVNQMENNASRR